MNRGFPGDRLYHLLCLALAAIRQESNEKIQLLNMSENCIMMKKGEY